MGAPILGGVNYAGWGYLTKKPRTEQEWAWGVECMREVAEYAKETGNVTICVECVIFILPALLMLCDKLICVTTLGMKKAGKESGKGGELF